MVYPYLLFDLDGTLVDSLADLAEAVNVLRGELGLAPLAESQVAAATGDGAAALVRRCLPEGLDSPPRLSRFLAIYAHQLEAPRTRPFPGIPELLRDLAAARLGLVTNKPLAATLQLLEALDLRRYFDSIVAGDSLAEKKPHPAPVRLALQQLGHCDEAALLIGDHHTDLRAGLAAGVDTCFCGWGLGHDDGVACTLRAERPEELRHLLLGEGAR